ncbi:hypothetical protein B0T14DRAFT_565660 [Immersiella caudata]|uniref:Uncharacterized protein n=1 Tax=Immersiella caudata TaxID=314043 RepID=A0AA39WZ98_9PEZI|nr:hypothetical protein B0T14DRAFT_565660 [Immersiella caudata]
MPDLSLPSSQLWQRIVRPSEPTPVKEVADYIKLQILSKRPAVKGKDAAVLHYLESKTEFAEFGTSAATLKRAFLRLQPKEPVFARRPWNRGMTVDRATGALSIYLTNFCAIVSRPRAIGRFQDLSLFEVQPSTADPEAGFKVKDLIQPEVVGMDFLQRSLYVNIQYVYDLLEGTNQKEKKGQTHCFRPFPGTQTGWNVLRYYRKMLTGTEYQHCADPSYELSGDGEEVFLSYSKATWEAESWKFFKHDTYYDIGGFPSLPSSRHTFYSKYQLPGVDMWEEIALKDFNPPVFFLHNLFYNILQASRLDFNALKTTLQNGPPWPEEYHYVGVAKSDLMKGFDVDGSTYEVHLV